MELLVVLLLPVLLVLAPLIGWVFIGACVWAVLFGVGDTGGLLNGRRRRSNLNQSDR